MRWQLGVAIRARATAASCSLVFWLKMRNRVFRFLAFRRLSDPLFQRILARSAITQDRTLGSSYHQKNGPVVIKPAFIGKMKLPAYYVPANLMADPCDRTYIVLTNQTYAREISASCESEEKLHRYVSSNRLPKGYMLSERENNLTGRSCTND